MKAAAKLYPLVAVLAVAGCSESTAVQPVTQFPAIRSALTLAAEPASVTIAGTFQSELGCTGDWQPDCVTTNLAYDANDGIWQGVFLIPAGSSEYKGALNGSWDENYGKFALLNGPNIQLAATGSPVKFYYDNNTHWLTDNVNSVIAIAPGSFQSELGCQSDWDPSCLRSWLQDPDGDGIYSFTTSAIPAGSYEAKVAIDESWEENYGADGVQNGANIPFTVAENGTPVTFSYDAATHVLSISTAAPQIDDLIEDLKSTIGDLSLQRGINMSLSAKINALEAALEADDSAAACQALSDIGNFTRAQSGRKISSASADEIISQVSEIAEAIGC